MDVRPATAERWDDVATLFGRRGGGASSCWCQVFVGTGPAGTPSKRDALHEEITHAAAAPGLIAYVDDHPVGWTRVGPRSTLPGVLGNRALTRVLKGDGAWWVTCFKVDSRERRSGVGAALLRAAIEYARENGAKAVEGHPVDVAALKATRVSGSAIYTGTVAMFTAAGFTEIARTYPTRPVMRLELRP